MVTHTLVFMSLLLDAARAGPEGFQHALSRDDACQVWNAGVHETVDTRCSTQLLQTRVYPDLTCAVWAVDWITAASPDRLNPFASGLRELFRGSSLAGGARLILVLGEQKCGTTLLHQMLSEHPNISSALSGTKELHVFDTCRPKTCRIDWCILDGYAKEFPVLQSPGELVIDSTPDLLSNPAVARVTGSIFSHLPKLIALLRHPVMRAHAAWDQNRRSGHELRSFQIAMRDELPTAEACSDIVSEYFRVLDSDERPVDFQLDYQEGRYINECDMWDPSTPACWNSDVDQSHHPACKRYLIKGFYAFHVQVWHRYHGPDAIHIIRSEDLFDAVDERAGAPSRLAAVLGPLYDFLDMGVPSIGESVKSAKLFEETDPTCWHACNSSKTSLEDVSDAELRATLNGLYLKTLHRLGATTGIFWSGWPSD